MVQDNTDTAFAAKILGPLDEFLDLPKEYQEAFVDQAINGLPEELKEPALTILAKGIEAYVQQSQAANNIVAFNRLLSPTR